MKSPAVSFAFAADGRTIQVVLSTFYHDGREEAECKTALSVLAATQIAESITAAAKSARTANDALNNGGGQ